LHFDYEKIDDLVTKDSVSNDTQIQTSKDYYSTLRQLFDNPSYPKEDVIGTIYHFNDLYCDLRKSRRMVESFVPVSQEGGVSFPERFSSESLSSILIDVGPYEYATQYMLNPVNPADAKFKGEWVKYYEKTPEGLAEYIVCDPASTQKKRSDYTVIMRWGVDHAGNHYLLEGVRDKFTAFQRIDALFMLVRNSRSLKWVKYEVIGGRHGDLEIIRKRQIDEQLFFRIEETKSSTGSKADRIEQRLVPAYHAGVIFWPRQLTYKSMYDGRTHDFVQDIQLEYLQFPFSEHDDILDCQSQMFEEPKMIVKGSSPVVVVPSKGMTADDWEKFYNNLDREKRLHNGLTDKEIHDKRLVKKFRSIVARNA
jgi:phage terminase large subunit-like protein